MAAAVAVAGLAAPTGASAATTRPCVTADACPSVVSASPTPLEGWDFEHFVVSWTVTGVAADVSTLLFTVPDIEGPPIIDSFYIAGTGAPPSRLSRSGSEETVTLSGLHPANGEITVGYSADIELDPGDLPLLNLSVGLASSVTSAPSDLRTSDTAYTLQVIDQPRTGPGPDLGISDATTGPTVVGRLEPGYAAVGGRLHVTVRAPDGAPTTSTLVLRFPPGVHLSPRNEIDQTPSGIGGFPAILVCGQAGAVVTCVMSVSGLVDIVTGIVADPSVPIGTTADITATVQPNGLIDPDPADNSVTVPVRVDPTAALALSISPGAVGASPVPIGVATTYLATVTNTGPEVADAVVLTTSVQLPSGHVTDVDPYLAGDLDVTGLGPHPVGDIAPGQSRSVAVVVTGHSVGIQFALGVDGTTTSYVPDPQCADTTCIDSERPSNCPPTRPPNNLPECIFTQSRSIVVVAAVVLAPALRPPPSVTLADTGAKVGALPAVGLALVLTGLGLSWQGRRRTGLESGRGPDA
jgi:hypothetical protein